MLPALERRPIDTDNMLDLFRRDLSLLGQDMSRAFGGWWPAEFEDERVTASYPVDISERDNKLFVDAELPGFAKKDIDISVDSGVLSISAERTEKKNGKDETQHLRERRYTKVQRRFTLPSEVDEKKASVKFENGVLHLELPKKGESKARKIPVS